MEKCVVTAIYKTEGYDDDDDDKEYILDELKVPYKYFDAENIQQLLEENDNQILNYYKGKESNTETEEGNDYFYDVLTINLDAVCFVRN